MTFFLSPDHRHMFSLFDWVWDAIYDLGSCARRNGGACTGEAERNH